jgi:FecR protein
MSFKQLPKIFSLGMIFVIAMYGCQSSTSAPSAPLTAGIKEIIGTVNMKQAGSSDFVKATANSILQAQGSVQTGSDGRVRLDLSTGTIIRLSPSSLFTLVSNQESSNNLVTTLKLDIGRLFIILSGGSLDVNTPSGVASVRGSYLSVTVDPVTHDVTVTCLEGHCSANNPAGTVDLTNGQKTVLFHPDPTTGQFTAPGLGPMSPQDYQNWLDANPEAQNIINQASGTLTAMAPTEPPATQPPATETPAPTATQSTTGSTGSGGTQGCGVIGPLGGSSVPKYGPVTFSWNAQPGAADYIVTFHFPNGGTAQIHTTDTSINRYAESMAAGGNYSWDVTAVDGSGNNLCHSDPVTFTKLKSAPDKPKPVEPTPVPMPTFCLYC